MAKKRTFAAKLAHETTMEGKLVCPNCNVEMKRTKLIRSKKSKADSWSPNYEFLNICKCNENDVYAGKLK